MTTVFYNLGQQTVKQSRKLPDSLDEQEPAYDETKITVQSLGTRTSPAGTAEQMLLPSADVGKPANVKAEKDLAGLMHSVRPGSLGGVKIYANGFNPSEAYSRIWHNPRTSFLGKTLGLATQWPMLLQDPEGFAESGPFYMPLSDVVNSPWKSEAATMHELGHAIDFNSGSVPKSWLGRQVKGLGRDLYTMLPFPGKTLHQEHAAWNKGTDAYLEGAAKKGLKWDDVQKHLQKTKHARTPALGSYWGATIGTGAGLAGTAALLYAMRDMDLTRPAVRAAMLPLMLGAGLGGITGMGIGSLLRDSSATSVAKEFKQRYNELVQKFKTKSEDKSNTPV